MGSIVNLADTHEIYRKTLHRGSGLLFRGWIGTGESMVGDTKTTPGQARKGLVNYSATFNLPTLTLLSFLPFHKERLGGHGYLDSLSKLALVERIGGLHT